MPVPRPCGANPPARADRGLPGLGPVSLTAPKVSVRWRAASRGGFPERVPMQARNCKHTSSGECERKLYRKFVLWVYKNVFVASALKSRQKARRVHVGLRGPFLARRHLGHGSTKSSAAVVPLPLPAPRAFFLTTNRAKKAFANARNPRRRLHRSCAAGSRTYTQF